MKTYKITVRDGATCRKLDATVTKALSPRHLRVFGDKFRDITITKHSDLLVGEPDDVYWDYEEVDSLC